LNTVIMHSSVYYNRRINDLVDTVSANTYSDMAAFRTDAATAFVGRVGQYNLFLNDRVYNTGGVYDTIVAGPGSVYMGWQVQNSIEAWRDPLLAGGTDLIKYVVAYSMHIPGASYTATAPAGIGGATDANLYTATNWTATTDYSHASKVPMVVIKSLAE